MLQKEKINRNINRARKYSGTSFLEKVRARRMSGILMKIEGRVSIVMLEIKGIYFYSKSYKNLLMK